MVCQTCRQLPEFNGDKPGGSFFKAAEQRKAAKRSRESNDDDEDDEDDDDVSNEAASQHEEDDNVMPLLWRSGYDLRMFIDCPMHLLFLGVVGTILDIAAAFMRTIEVLEKVN